MILAILALFALTRAEIVQRMRTPVITQADGLVKVYASCDEDIRRDFQGPVAGMAADTVKMLYGSLGRKSQRFESPGIILRIGNERTNNTEVVVGVETNDARVVSRIFLKSPAFADRAVVETELTRAFYRAVVRQELSFEEARLVLRRANPKYRVADERAKLESWLAHGLEPAEMSEEEFFAEIEAMLMLYRKVLEPGKASHRDILTFASRLYLYPRSFGDLFVGGADVLSLAEAIPVARHDARVRVLAAFKAQELPVWAGGRGELLQDASLAYIKFLLELSKGKLSDAELEKLLEIADLKLKAADAQTEG